MVLDDLATYINGLSLGMPVQKGFFQEIPDVAIALRETGGMPPQYVNGVQQGILDERTLQIVTRATDYPTAMSLCQQLYTALSGLRDVTLNAVFYHFVRAMQPPFFLQRDHNHRFECAFNVQVTRRNVP